MAKNIEININTGNNTYEVLYPLISLSNTTSDLLPLDKTSGNLSSSRISGTISSGNLPKNIQSGSYKGTGNKKLSLSFSFTVLFVIIGAASINGYYGLGFFTKNLASYCMDYSNASKATVLFVNNLFSLELPDGNAASAMNTQNTTYIYMGLG